MLCLWMAELSGWSRDHVGCKAKNNCTCPAAKTVHQTLLLILMIPRSLSSHWPFLLISSHRCSRAISDLRPKQCSSLLPQTCPSSLPVSVNCVIIKPRFLQQRLWIMLDTFLTPTPVCNPQVLCSLDPKHVPCQSTFPPALLQPPQPWSPPPFALTIAVTFNWPRISWSPLLQSFM